MTELSDHSEVPELSEDRFPVADQVGQALRQLLHDVSSRRPAAQEASEWRAVERELGLVVDELDAQRAEVEAALERLQGRQRLLLRGLHAAHDIAAALVDRDGIIRDVNLRAQQVLGPRTASHIGKPLVAFVDLDRRGEARAALRQALQTDSVITVEVTIAGRNMPSQNSVIALARQSSPHHWRGPGALCLVLPLTSPPTGPTDHASLARRTADVSRLTGLSLAEGGITTALRQVIDLAVSAVPTVIGARMEWWDVTGSHVLISGQEPAAGQKQMRLPVEQTQTDRGATMSPSIDAGALAPENLLSELDAYLQTARALLADDALLRETETVRDQLQEALRSRAVIDQAKGMIMMAVSCDADAAFAHLVRLSSNTNVKLRDVASRLVDDARRGRRPLE